MLSMRTIIPSVAIAFAIFWQSAVVAQQIGDRVKINGRTFTTAQQPLAGYWRLPDPPDSPGTVTPPIFEGHDTFNYRGHVAEWEFKDRKLFLAQVECQVEGGPATAEQLFPGRKYPIQATWFTGKIQIVLDDWHDGQPGYFGVITFHVKQGLLQNTTFKEYGTVLQTWNGLPPKAKVSADNEQHNK